MIYRQPPAESDVRAGAAARAGQWEMGWTKHGTPCMTRPIGILYDPAAHGESFDQDAGLHDPAPEYN